MDSKSIQLIKDSFKMVTPIADQAAEIFYTKLFEKAPQLKPMFKGDMKKQGEKLMSILGFTVDWLTDIKRFVPVLEELGKNHVDYGVKNKHYKIVGVTFLETLEAGLGEHWTPELKKAWSEAYKLIAKTMIKGAKKAQKKWWQIWI